MIAAIGTALQVVAACFIFHRCWDAALGIAVAQIPTWMALKHVRRAASPLSSDLVHLGRNAVRAQIILIVCWGVAICLA